MSEKNFKVTQMTLTTELWFYRINRVHESVGDDKWVISRWNVEAAKIPPLERVWTKHGWKPTMNRDSELEYLSQFELHSTNIFL